jgi:hypothetical protein
MISVESEQVILPASYRWSAPAGCDDGGKLIEMRPIVAASTNISLLATVHDLVRCEQGTLIAVLCYERFVSLLERLMLRGTICIDLVAPEQVRQAALRLMPALKSLATLIWIGMDTVLLESEQAIFQPKAALTFAFPADAVAFRHAIRRLNLPGR